MSQELKPCPFCGHHPEIEDCRTVWVVRCQCGASVLGTRAPEPDGNETDEYWLGIRQTAITAWNRRHEAQQPAQAAADARDAGLIADLRDIATGKTQHVYAGICPDLMEGHDTRDDECPACKVLLRADTALSTYQQGGK